MANSLNRNLTVGEKVKLKSGQTVEVIEGFGMFKFTMGTALHVKFESGQQARVDGYDLAAQ